MFKKNNIMLYSWNSWNKAQKTQKYKSEDIDFHYTRYHQ